MDILDLFLDLSGLQDRCVPGSYGRWGKQWVHRQGDAAAYICKTETRRIIRCKGKAVLNTCCYLFEIRWNIVSFPLFHSRLPSVEIRSRNSKDSLHSGNICVVVILQREGSAFWLLAIVGCMLSAPAKIRCHPEYQEVEITRFHQFGQMFRFTNKDLQIMPGSTFVLFQITARTMIVQTKLRGKNHDECSKACFKVNWRLNFASCQVKKKTKHPLPQNYKSFYRHKPLKIITASGYKLTQLYTICDICSLETGVCKRSPPYWCVCVNDCLDVSGNLV